MLTLLRLRANVARAASRDENHGMKRNSANPILTRADIPPIPPHVVDVSSVFNPGAIRLGDRYYLLLRVQTRGRETVLMVAESADGERFVVRPRLVQIAGLEAVRQTLYHVYDPRLTRIEDIVYVVFAADTDDGCRLGIARTQDFEHFELVSFGGDDDTRNGVLFPERIGGRYLRLERPNRTRLDSGSATSGDRSSSSFTPRGISGYQRVVCGFGGIEQGRLDVLARELRILAEQVLDAQVAQAGNQHRNGDACTADTRLAVV